MNVKKQIVNTTLLFSLVLVTFSHLQLTGTYDFDITQ